jgi:uncharacterized RmlC-like cupin family protein
MPEDLLSSSREVEVGDERAVYEPGGLVLVPAMVPHAFRNVGETRARIVGFFSSNTVVAITDDAVQPVGGRVIGSPPPDVVGAI